MRLYVNKAFKFPFFIVLLMISLTSCIELEEKIIINQDLSGKYSLTLKGLGSLQSSLPSSIFLPEMMKKLKETAEKVDGITAVEEIRTKDQIGFSFSFRHPRAIKHLMAKFAQISPIFVPAYFKATKHRFNKKNVTSILLKAIQQDETFSALLSTTSELPFGNFFYWTTVVSTPRPIKKVKNNGFVTLSDDKRTATLRLSLDQIRKDVSSGFTLAY